MRIPPGFRGYVWFQSPKSCSPHLLQVASSRSNPRSIVAIHGLETTSAGTWVYVNKHAPTKINWLKDPDMLPKDVPTAQIYTYNWPANFLSKSIDEPLRGHAKSFLAALGAELRTMPKRPIIFIASCFGGLLLAKVQTAGILLNAT